ncbi:MAG: glycosyltransferase family 1 protein [Alphaproteobacteria bacterium]|nr:glycosyltransferase family 1 protein [Alphaproteobacteria bacterium]
MKIVLVGEAHHGSRTPQRARALRDLGHEVVPIGTMPEGWTHESRAGLIDRVLYRLRLPWDWPGAGRAMVRAARGGCDLIVLDNARAIRPGALRAAKRAAPGVRIVWYSEDDMLNPINRSRWIERSLGLFDLCVTTKSFNAEAGELPSLGARGVMFVDNTYCSHEHCPIDITEDERIRWGAPVSFVGTFEAPRADMALELARAGISVRVWGNGWGRRQGAHPNLIIENRPVYGDDYRRVVAASRINLCFLRHANRDRQTCRSIEIPAMGGFMLHEYSGEMVALIAPDREAVYFRNGGDLIARCRDWLQAPARAAVAAAGRRRVVEGGFSHRERWREIIDRVMRAP